MEAESERPLADPPATWQEHWFDHRQLLRLYQSDEHCAIYVDPDVRWAEAQWLPRFINVTWQYSLAAAPAVQAVMGQRQLYRSGYSAPTTLKSWLTKTWCGQLTPM